MLVALFINKVLRCSPVIYTENSDIASQDEEMDESSTGISNNSQIASEEDATEQSGLRLAESNDHTFGRTNEGSNHNRSLAESEPVDCDNISIYKASQSDICVPFIKKEVPLMVDYVDMICRGYCIESTNAEDNFIIYNDDYIMVRNIHTGILRVMVHKYKHIADSKTIRYMESNFKYKEDTLETKISILFDTPASYFPEIFVMNRSEKEFYRNNVMRCLYIYDYQGDIHKGKINLGNTVPELDEVTSDTTVPECIPVHGLMVKYFEKLALVLSKLEQSQSRMKLHTVKAQLQSDESLNNFVTEFKNNSREVFSSEEASASAVNKYDDIFVNEKYTHTMDIQSNGINIKAPFDIVYPYTNETVNQERCEFDVMKFYVPTQIEENCVFEGSVVFLRIKDKSCDDACDSVNIIGKSNYFIGPSKFKYSAQGISIGNNSKLKNYYLGPYVTIGDYCDLNFVAVHARSEIGNRSKIGKYVNIGKNVIIGKNVTIKDYVTIEDGVTIGNNAVLRNNVYIYKNATIGENVRLDRGIIIGKNTTIGRNTQMSVSCFVGDDAKIGNYCYFICGIHIEGTMTVENNCRLENEIWIKVKSDFVTGKLLTSQAEKSTIGENSIMHDKIYFSGSCDKNTKINYKNVPDKHYNKFHYFPA